MGACRASSVTESESVKHRHHRRHALLAWSPRSLSRRVVGSRRKFLSLFLSFLKTQTSVSIATGYLLHSIPRSSSREHRERFVGGSGGNRGERDEKLQLCSRVTKCGKSGMRPFLPTGSPVRTCISATALSGLSGARAIVVVCNRSCADSCDVSIV